MATYYKYAERDANSQVNWSEITSNMVNSLKEVQTIRDSKRKAINDATTELSTTLSEAPQGEHKGLNEFAMTYANNAQEMRLMQDKLLKSGQLKLKDYNIGRANLTQGTSKLFNLSKKYQAQYKVKMDRLEGGLSATQEQWQMSELEGFANFSNHEAYINPTNGQVNMGKLIDKEVAGKTVRTMDRTPGSFTTIDQLNFAVSDQVNKYNLDNFNAEVSNFAKTYLTTNGAYSSLDDVRQMPEFESMKKNIIKSQLVDPRAVGSILTNFVGIASNGKSFTFTRDPNKKDANTILLVDDPNQPGSGRLSPDFSGSVGKKQMESAEKFLDTQLERQLPSKETTKAVPDLTSSEIVKEQQGSVVDLWNSLYSTKDSAKRNSIVSSIISSPYNKESKNMLKDIIFVSRNIGTEDEPVMGDFMEVRYENPAGNRTGNKAIPITDSYVDWAAAGVELHGVQDKAKREKGLSTKSIFGGGKDKSFEGTSAGRGEEIESNVTNVRKKVRQFFGKSKKYFVNQDEDVIMTKLQASLSSLGFKFETSYGFGSDRIKVISPNNPEDQFDFVVGDSTDNSDDLLNWILPKITNEAADVFMESGVDISKGIIIEESKVTKPKPKLPGS